jgi:hypothetical protein
MSLSSPYYHMRYLVGGGNSIEATATDLQAIERNDCKNKDELLVTIWAEFGMI